MAQFSEEAVHAYLFKTGLTDLVDDTAALDEEPVDVQDDFQLWRIIKARTLAKLQRLHNSVRNGEFLGSKLSTHQLRRFPTRVALARLLG